MPRVVRFRPRNGDVHPVEATVLRAKLLRLPLEYLYGLKRIELRARPGLVGQPYGYYRIGAKLIVLYSMPLRWRPGKDGGLDLILLGAVSSEFIGDDLRLSWRSPQRLESYFHEHVVLHEIGHHHSYQWRRSRRPALYGRRQEAAAELRADRLREKRRER